MLAGGRSRAAGCWTHDSCSSHLECWPPSYVGAARTHLPPAAQKANSFKSASYKGKSCHPAATVSSLPDCGVTAGAV